MCRGVGLSRAQKACRQQGCWVPAGRWRATYFCVVKCYLSGGEDSKQAARGCSQGTLTQWRLTHSGDTANHNASNSSLAQALRAACAQAGRSVIVPKPAPCVASTARRAIKQVHAAEGAQRQRVPATSARQGLGALHQARLLPRSPLCPLGNK